MSTAKITFGKKKPAQQKYGLPINDKNATLAQVEAVEQDELKLNVKLWLKANNYSYAWLAEKCFVTESTVRNWMARKLIPAAKVHIIRFLPIKPTLILMIADIRITTTAATITQHRATQLLHHADGAGLQLTAAVRRDLDFRPLYGLPYLV